MSRTPILDEAIAELEKLDSASILALVDVVQERVRQLSAEGWSTAHDDEHSFGEMAAAAGCYALHARLENTVANRKLPPPPSWPWSYQWWKPKSPIRDCTRAGALLLAELARWYRLPKPAARDDDRSDRR